jgi:hypothetical protein
MSDLFTTTGNPTIQPPSQTGTDYYLISFTDPLVKDYSITFKGNVQIDYLVVGGGGGGGGGIINTNSNNSTDYQDSYGGGGGSSGDLLIGSFDASVGKTLNIIVGDLGTGGSAGSSSIISGSGLSTITANGGYSGNSGNGNGSTIYGGAGGINPYGTGGTGAASSADYPTGGNNTYNNISSVNASSYPANQFTNFVLNGTKIGTVGGGGGGGGSITTNQNNPASLPEGGGGGG